MVNQTISEFTFDSCLLFLVIGNNENFNSVLCANDRLSSFGALNLES